MTLDSKVLASVLVDEALVCAMIPWPCPGPFGPGGRYMLQEIVSIGPRSLVYKAVDQQLSSEGFEAVVIIKVANRPGGSAVDARSARRVEHPGVVRVLDFGIEPDSGVEYLVTEFVAGGDLAGAGTPMAPRRAAEIIAKVARAVQAAHSSGVVHCDLKPANVLMTREGEPKLADFDLCRSPLAQESTARGNEAFMSPEQRQGGEDGLTPLADVYALGGMLRWLITGCLPAEASPLRLDADLQAVIDRALEPDRSKRRESAGALAQDLEDWLAFRPVVWRSTGVPRRVALWVRRRPALAVSYAAILLVVAGAAVFQWQRIKTEQRERERANEAIVAGLKQRIEELQGKSAVMLKGFAQMFSAGGAISIDRAFQQARVLEMLRNSMFTGDSGRAVADEQILETYRSVVEYADVELGSGDTSEVMLARFALAHVLIDRGLVAEAAPHVERLKAWWSPKLAPTDPLLKAIGLMESCVLAANQPDEAHKQRIAKLIEDAASEGACESSRLLASRFLSRLAAESQTPR